MKILLTGGTGYIGSHVAITLANAGYQVILFDNLTNSCKEVYYNLSKIISTNLHFVKGDLNQISQIKNVFKSFNIDAVLHFAGYKSVNESLLQPLNYYYNNFIGTINLIREMQNNNIKILIFSSSATVYGDPQYLPMDEKHSLNPKNPYGKTKLYVEEFLDDIYQNDKDWRLASLRYFNPIGSHESGLIGDLPRGSVNNLMPLITQVALKKKKKLFVFGNDYSTHDGTAIRDYIHIMDLAEGHQETLNFLLNNKGYYKLNLGTGHGNSVLDLIKCFEKTNDCKIPFEFVSRREGDVAISFADPKKANEILKWKTSRTLDEMSKSSWNFIKKLG